MKTKSINIGCGKDIKKNFINIDSYKAEGVDIVFDLNDIFKGEKLPFKDNSIDFVYCSHVLEDFIEPIPIIKEMIRICKNEGLIELRFPFETNTWNTNIYHKRCFTFSMFDYLLDNVHYGEKLPLKIFERKYYVELGNSKFQNIQKKFAQFLFNKLGYKIVENTFIKYLFPVVNLKIVFMKKENEQ